VRLSPRDGGGYTLGNGLLEVGIDSRGLVVSAYDLGAERETVAAGLAANLLQIHPDLPNQWDAWDVDAFYRNTVTDLTGVDELVPVREGDTAGVRIVRTFGASKVTQLLTLAPGVKRLDITTEVDWHETEKFLKAAFPLDIHADRYASKTQFGHVHRPTHTNTSWETASWPARDLRTCTAPGFDRSDSGQWASREAGVDGWFVVEVGGFAHQGHPRSVRSRPARAVGPSAEPGRRHRHAAAPVVAAVG
jgi:alpha-mannosidase